MRQVWTRGSERVDRTGVGTRALFGALRTEDPAFPVARMIAWLDAHPEIARLNATVRHRHV
jgi:hypothetical protein